MGEISSIYNVIQTEFRLFEECFSSTLKTNNPLLRDVLDYIYTKRGKQLRPILVLLSAGLCRSITNKTIQVATSLELMHTASLMHDDVVDNSPTRRGDKAVHERWNNKIAILVGDYMLSQSIELLSQLRNTTILNIVAEHFGVTVADIKSSKRNSELVLPRQIFMFLCREMIDIPNNFYVNNRSRRKPYLK